MVVITPRIVGGTAKGKVLLPKTKVVADQLLAELVQIDG